MKKCLLAMFVLMAANAAAQEVEAVDSIDLETGVFYPANGVKETTPDTICVDSLFATSVPQIPLGSCDSLMVSSPDDRYGVIWKGGKCGIYDISKRENVTRIEYKELWLSSRKEIEGNYYTYFGWNEDKCKGVIGVAEINNEFVAISFPKKDDEGKEERQ